MSSIINSISAGELQVQHVPEVKPVKEDSIIDLLQQSEIEFETCPKLEKIPEPEILYEIEEFHKEMEEKPPIELLDPEHLLTNPNIQLENDTTDDFNTGFGSNNDLHYKDPCVKPPLKTPLYKENYLNEFVTEADKAAVRQALGLYNHDDVVSLSLLTTSDDKPTNQELKEVVTKQMRQADKFFAPFTVVDAVYTTNGTTLKSVINTLNVAIENHNKELLNITKESGKEKLTSLGDITKFLQGFNNGDSLHDKLDDINQEMLRFEKLGQFNIYI